MVHTVVMVDVVMVHMVVSVDVGDGAYDCDGGRW